MRRWTMDLEVGGPDIADHEKVEVMPVSEVEEMVRLIEKLPRYSDPFHKEPWRIDFDSVCRILREPVSEAASMNTSDGLGA